jgi:hypothetical protein
MYCILNNIIDATDQTASSAAVNDRETSETTEILPRTDETSTNKPITFLRAWLLPGVAMVKNEFRSFLE